MSEIASITEFIRRTGATYRVFDMGRRVRRIDNDAFERFENGEIPWEAPLQRAAWLGLVFWQPGAAADDHYIWFLRLPLDEQGGLEVASRDTFLHRLVERVGRNIEAAQKGGEIDSAMKDNPFAFSPKPDRLAVFHAHAQRLLDGEPSGYYPHAREYFAGEVGFDQWAFVGIQGIADVCARLDRDGNAERLAEAIPELPVEPLEAVGGCLENEPVAPPLTGALVERLQGELADPSPRPAVVVALVRGLSAAEPVEHRRAALVEVLESETGRDIEVLAAVAGRCWEDMADADVRRAFLEALAANPLGQDAFNNVLADLLFIPGVRPHLLQAFRDPGRSPALGRALGELFQGLGQGE